MNKLYPLKFEPILKDKIWGGRKLHDFLNKKDVSDKAGESWEISGFQDNISVVSNGFLAGNTLQELIEVYMGDLVGESVFEKFGIEFPLLIKFIDAHDDLSIQVHPDDILAHERHNSFGKTEMWYIIQAEENARLIVGFNEKINKETYLKHLKNKTLNSILHEEKVSAGDATFLPAGRVHAIGAGILLAEIQQTSDVTYRIYDYDRKDTSGNLRELHTDLALDAIDYNLPDNYKIDYDRSENKNSELVACNYFTTNFLKFNQPIEKDYSLVDSFVIYMCVGGGGEIDFKGEETIPVSMGETILIPADLNEITIKPDQSAEILEVYIK
jgi:mannose-6-phosphate isomerase